MIDEKERKKRKKKRFRMEDIFRSLFLSMGNILPILPIHTSRFWSEQLVPLTTILGVVNSLPYCPESISYNSPLDTNFSSNL
jgi:hypothetical protein